MVKLTKLMLALAALCILLVLSGRAPFLTPDQKAHRLFQQGDHAAAADTFSDPLWKGAAHFKDGEFEKAANVFSGVATAEGYFNHGNSLVMMGQYESAIARYDRALALSPDWNPAVENREIAVQGAAYIKAEGGEGTGGKLGADDIVFNKGQTPPGSDDGGDEEVQGPSDAEMRAVWLRQVQSSPADFLRAKFSYQHARSDNE